MPLPTERTPKKNNMSELTTLVYGRSKIGKSTWCSQAEGALFLATEPGLNSLEVYQESIQDWAGMLVALGEIAKGDHPFKTVIIDTIDNAYQMCSAHVLAEFKVKHESDMGFGKGWALVNSEFQRVLTKLAFLPYGLILISHSQEVEMETRTGKYSKTVPTLPDKARKIVLGLVDIILYCDTEAVTDASGTPGYRRVMRTKPNQFFDAGDRTGRLPETIDLDYQAFIQAFNEGGK